MGICAPVKMRAAVPGWWAAPTTPAGTRWVTGNTVPKTRTSAAQSA